MNIFFHLSVGELFYITQKTVNINLKFNMLNYIIRNSLTKDIIRNVNIKSQSRRRYLQ